MSETTFDIGIKQGRKGFYADFKKRYEEYSKLWWKNKKWMDKTKVEGQVPAFAIRLISDQGIIKLKNNFPEIYNEIQKMSIVFQYVKYRPKRAAGEWARDTLARAKYKFNWWKWDQQAKWYHITARSPTRESLGLTQSIEQFKLNYPKLLYRKADWTNDNIKSDWTGYLVTMVRHPLNDWQVIWQDYFFKFPATIRATQKVDLDERVFKRISKVLDELEEIVSMFEYWDQEMYTTYKSTIIKLANSLTLDWLNEQLKERQEREQAEELSKRMLVTEVGDINWDSSSDVQNVDWEKLSQGNTVEVPKKNVEKEVDWDSFTVTPTVTQEWGIDEQQNTWVNKKKDEVIDWDSF